MDIEEKALTYFSYFCGFMMILFAIAPGIVRGLKNWAYWSLSREEDKHYPD